DQEGVFMLRDLVDGIRIAEFIREVNPKSALIYGGGYIGMEMAESFRELGLDLTVVVRSRVAGREEAEIAELVRDELLKHGVRVEESCTIRSFEKVSGRIRAETNKGTIDADIVLVAAGVVPNSEIARDAGIETGFKNAIATDARQRTNVPDIYAAGDCADALHLVTGKKTWIPLGDTANKQGRVAGANMAGEELIFPGVVGTAVFKVFDLEVARTGLTEAQAKSEGFDAGTAVINASSRAHYYPGGSRMRIKLVFDKTSGRLLGAHMAGKEGVAKRIDVFAAALHARMTVDEVAFLDLAYAPPFAPVWDPVLVAAQVARKGVKR
ncbi:MAG TPA: NADH oxidase, partial [Proteobacteria bacterium]|nr:NADH oxidase [Pseudomonadota bacterium]